MFSERAEMEEVRVIENPLTAAKVSTLSRTSVAYGILPTFSMLPQLFTQAFSNTQASSFVYTSAQRPHCNAQHVRDSQSPNTDYRYR
jgi:hypothetical protein